MKKIIILFVLIFGLQTNAQIGNLYIYNNSTLAVRYQLSAYPNGVCYPEFAFSNAPSSAGFTIPAGGTHLFAGFVMPTTPNFPTAPVGSGGWKWKRKNSGTATPLIYTQAVAQNIAGLATSTIQARWKYFKFDTNGGPYSGGIGFSSGCSTLSTTYTSGTFVAQMYVSGADTIVMITN
jgi:hypothetical protein